MHCTGELRLRGNTFAVDCTSRLTRCPPVLRKAADAPPTSPEHPVIATVAVISPCCTARPSASESASATAFIGCHGGDDRRNAPGRPCHASTASRGGSITLEYTNRNRLTRGATSPVVTAPKHPLALTAGYLALRGVQRSRVESMNIRTGMLSLVDSVLDRAIVPGYTNVGYLLRQHGWGDADPPPDALRGKTTLVTGANSGIGKAIAAGLAGLGATVLITVRDAKRGQQARDEIMAARPGADLQVEVCDVANLAAVRAFATDLSRRQPRLDVLIHNAGVLPANRTETDDGHEITLATHVLGPVLLTEQLAPILANSNDPRVILMSSGGMYTQSLPADDPEYRNGQYRGATAYARTKRMQVALASILADRWTQERISVYCMHPGWADTPGVADTLPAFRRLTGPLLRSPHQGADTALWLAATIPAPATGRFWHDRRTRPEHYLPLTRESEQDRRLLWRYCAEAIDIDP